MRAFLLFFCFMVSTKVVGVTSGDLLPNCDERVPRSTVEALVSAIRSGNVGRVKRIAKDEIDLNCDPGGHLEAPKPFIVEATLALKPKVVDVLMKEGVKADFAYPPLDSMAYLTFPLLTAAGLNRYDIVYIMIENGASIDVMDSANNGIAYYLRTSSISKKSSLYKWYLKVKKISEKKV